MSLLKIASERGVSDALQTLKLAGSASRRGYRDGPNKKQRAAQAQATSRAAKAPHFPPGSDQGAFQFAKDMPSAPPSAPVAEALADAVHPGQMGLPFAGRSVEGLMHGPRPEFMHGPTRPLPNRLLGNDLGGLFRKRPGLTTGLALGSLGLLGGMGYRAYKMHIDGEDDPLGIPHRVQPVLSFR